MKMSWVPAFTRDLARFPEPESAGRHITCMAVGAERLDILCSVELLQWLIVTLKTVRLCLVRIGSLLFLKAVFLVARSN